MGYTTDFIGHIDIEPGLNAQEIAYLTAFSESRRFARPGGPYAVPTNPRAEDETSFPVEMINSVPDGQPGYWCDWVPCWDGCCLAFNGNGKFYGAVRWLEYLIDHFLRPGALAAGSDEPMLAGFTFDHVLEGVVVGCRRDNKELFAIRVEGNVVTEEIIRPADARYVDYPSLPYEDAIDRQESPRRKRRRLRAVEGLPDEW